MQYDFSNQVTATLDALDEDTRRRLFSNIMALPEFGDIKALEGRHAGLYRQRIGDWRVIFAMEDDNVQVGYILPPRVATECESEGAGKGANETAGKASGGAAARSGSGTAPAAAPGSIAGNIGIAAVEGVKKSAGKGAGKKGKDKGKDKKKKKGR